MRIVSSALALAALLCMTSLGQAEPLLTMKDGAPSPGVIKSWSGSGKKITLTLRDGADAQAVLAAIESNVDGVRVKLKAGELLVIGMNKNDLLKALTEVELGGGADDVLAAAAMADDEFDSGSSLRAKKTAQLDKLLQDRATTALGRVVKVKSGTFPLTRVAIRVLRGPTGKLGKTIRKGRTIQFTPVIKMKGGQPDLTDETTSANIGAWFLKPGDRVQVKIGDAIKGGFEADLILR